MGSSEKPIMFTLRYNASDLGYGPNTVSVQYSYTDPSTKQTVTKTVNSTDYEYTFPCAVGDTVTFSNLEYRNPAINGYGTLFKNGVDVSPTNHESSYESTFSVTVNGESPYIEYYIDDTRH